MIHLLNQTTGKWAEIGRTTQTWFVVALRNAVSQPYGVSGVCG